MPKKEMPSDVKEVAEQMTKAQKKAAKHQGEPFDVYAYPAPTGADLTNPDALAAYNKRLSGWLPAWLTVRFSVKNHETKRIVYVNEVVYGDAFLKQRPMLSLSALPEGAQYLDDSGTWEFFKRGGANSVIEAQATKDLTAWGAYSDNNVQKIRKYIRRASHDPNAGESSPFDHVKPELVAFKNGTYDIKTGQLREHQAKDYLRARHDYAVDPTNNRAPETRKLLTAMLGDAAQFFIEYIGYMFYHSYAPFQFLVFLHGDGGEGKSTLLAHLANNILGKENVSTVVPAELSGERSHFNVMLLKDKEANICADISDGRLTNTGVLKSLTGNDLTKGENKGQDGVTFTNHAKLLFSANELPTFSDTTAGFADRVKVMRLINGDTRKNPGWWDQFDTKKIEAEAPAFAMESIQAFKAAMDRGKFSNSDALETSTNEWLTENDIFGQFLEDRCRVMRGNADLQTDPQQFYRSCKAWYEGSGYMPLSLKTISAKLQQRGISRRRVRVGEDRPYRYIGVELKENKPWALLDGGH
ncbi:phage/plasmid primase, P4 family [Lacticaseibacillus sp. 866-1]|uniref:DNA primase family protein n=1 Tax=Lacticaseibacillus sp. 866-1 TaxID=2799576 RepID=UPI00194260BE|nr:phage/plasmid primase, P4 family [Lacticaseibacillus sp. 866-1]